MNWWLAELVGPVRLVRAFTSGNWLLLLLSTPNSSHWNHFKLIFLFWFWWTLPMDNLKPYLYYKYRSVFTMLKQTNKASLNPSLETNMFVYACELLVTHEDLQIFFSLSFHWDCISPRRFALRLGMGGVLIPWLISNSSFWKSPKLCLCYPCNFLILRLHKR